MIWNIVCEPSFAPSPFYTPGHLALNNLPSLNKQHSFLVAISGGDLIHPSIPIDKITAVADIGTGTGYVLLIHEAPSIGYYQIYTSRQHCLTFNFSLREGLKEKMDLGNCYTKENTEVSTY
jgi:hypothetical protein